MVVVEPVPDQGTPWRSVNRMLRPVALLGLASLLAGVVVGGVGGRVVMTVSARAAGAELAGRVTENGNVIGEFTVGGTIALVVFAGLLGGMLASVGVVASDPWLGWMGGFKGLGFGGRCPDCLRLWDLRIDRLSDPRPSAAQCGDVLGVDSRVWPRGCRICRLLRSQAAEGSRLGTGGLADRSRPRSPAPLLVDPFLHVGIVLWLRTRLRDRRISPLHAPCHRCAPCIHRHVLHPLKTETDSRNRGLLVFGRCGFVRNSSNRQQPSTAVLNPTQAARLFPGSDAHIASHGRPSWNCVSVSLSQIPVA